jgi:transposase
MSTVKNLLLKFGIKGVKYNNFFIEKQCLFFEASLLKKKHICPKCKSKNIQFKGFKTRKFRMVPWGSMKCFLILTMHRVLCLNCKKRSWPILDFVNGKQRMVKSFTQYVLDLLLLGSILSVARFLNVSWDLVKDIHKNYLKSKYKRIPFKKLRYLSIDEFSLKKGHKYMTIFIDIETGRIIYAVEGRTKEDLKLFLQKLAAEATNLQGIAMDISVPYFSAVSQILPKIDIVFDHFHVTALINKALDDIRKYQQKNNKNVLKGQRFLLLRNYSDLDIDEKSRLDLLLKIN